MHRSCKAETTVRFCLGALSELITPMTWNSWWRPTLCWIGFTICADSQVVRRESAKLLIVGSIPTRCSHSQVSKLVKLSPFEGEFLQVRSLPWDLLLKWHQSIRHRGSSPLISTMNPEKTKLVTYTRYLDVKLKNGRHLRPERKIVRFPEGALLPQLGRSTINLIACCYPEGASISWVYKRHKWLGDKLVSTG